MNNSLRSEIALAFHEYAHPHALMPCKHLDYEQADQILALIESKMPEKKEYTKSTHSTVRSQLEIMKKQYTELGYNEAIDEVKSILRGSDDN